MWEMCRVGAAVTTGGDGVWPGGRKAQGIPPENILQ